MNTVLILGGVGFIGRNLVEAFHRHYQVVVVDVNLPTFKVPPGVIFYEGDFADFQVLEQVFSENHIDMVIHAAGRSLPGDPIDTIHGAIESELLPAINLLTQMKMNGVNKIVFLSSGGQVYGHAKTDKISETHSTDPISAYGISKLSIEKYIGLFHQVYGLEYLILRLSNPFGPYHQSNRQGLLNVLIRCILDEKPIEIWGSDTIVRDYIYVKDLANIVLSLCQQNISNKVLNVGSGTGHSIGQMIDLVTSRLGGVEIRLGPGRAVDIPRIVLDIGRLQQLVPLQFTPFEKAIDETHAWQQEEVKSLQT